MTRRSFGALAIAAVFAACSNFSSGNDAPPPPADGGADAPCGDLASDTKNCGACGNACGAAKACVSGACVPGCQGKIVYVSHDSGSDANDGCTPSTAMKSIGAAVAFVSTQNLEAHEIHVCRGTYDEHQLVVDHAASLRGAYNCLSWTRADKFGFESDFQDPNETIVQNADYASISTVDVASAAVGPGVVIEGFTILGAASGDKSSDALVVRDGASPVLTDLKLVGGATSNSGGGFGATALQIRNGASPEVKRFRFETGASLSPVAGAAGVLVTNAGVNIHDGAVLGGPSVGGSEGWVGIEAGQTSTNLPVTITDVNVAWSGVRVMSASSVGAIGILASGGPIAIKGTHVFGGDSTCVPKQCSSFGIQVENATNPQVVGNVVYAGDAIGMDGTVSTATFGIQLVQTTNALVADNAIHGGGRASPATVAASLGIDTLYGSSPTIIGNTIVVTGGPTNVYRSGLRFSGMAGQTDGARMAHVVGNLFVENLETNDFGIELDSCTGASIAELHDNAFVSTSYGGRVAPGTTCSPIQTYPTVDVAPLNGTNDLVIAPGCSSPTPPSGCLPIACANATECATKIFQTWDAGTLGAGNITSMAGYRLAANLTCAIAQRNYTLPSAASTDVYGTPRTSPFSIGAAELDGACTP